MFLNDVHNRMSQRRAGKIGVQRAVVETFITQYGYEYGIESPVGRHSKDGKVCRIFPVGISTDLLYGHYNESWRYLKEMEVNRRHGTSPPTRPVTLSVFCRY